MKRTTNADYNHDLAARLVMVAAEECDLDDLEEYVLWSVNFDIDSALPAQQPCIMQQVYAYRVGLVDRSWFVVAKADGSYVATYNHCRGVPRNFITANRRN